MNLRDLSAENTLFSSVGSRVAPCEPLGLHFSERLFAPLATSKRGVFFHSANEELKVMGFFQRIKEFFSPAKQPPTKVRLVRARDELGRYEGDDPDTPENEAYTEIKEN